MAEGEFNLNFLEEDTAEVADPAHYRHFFLEYAPEKWAGDVSGGAFQYFHGEDDEYTLMFSHSAEHGISLSYTTDAGGAYSMLVSVGDPARMDEIIDVGVDELRPVGSFISPQDAWVIVEGFLTAPMEKPASDKMIPIARANWPNLYE